MSLRRHDVWNSSVKTVPSESLVRETSPCGVQVCRTLSEYIETVDEDLMETYLKQLTSTVGDALK